MTKLIIKECRYCGKKIESLYESQAEYNLKAHELSCKERIKDGN